MTAQYGSGYTSATGDRFLFDNETNRAFVARFREWYQMGYVITSDIYGSYTSGLFTSTEGQKCYMSIASSAGAAFNTPDADSFEVGIAAIPQINSEAPKVISQGPSLCIFDNADSQEVLASWLFVKYLSTNVEFQATFSMASGYAPVIKSVSDNVVYKSWLENGNGTDNLNALAVKQAIAQSDAYFVSPAFDGSALVRYEVGALMVECFTEVTDDVPAMIKRAFEDAVTECEYQVD